MPRKQPIAIWIIGYTILQLILALLFGTMAYLNPSFQFPELVGNDAAAFAIGLFANRNFGVAVALIVALMLRNRTMLFTLLLMRFVTDLFDFGMALRQGADGIGSLAAQLLFFALILWIPELLAMRWLWRAETVAGNNQATSTSEVQQ